MEEYQQKQSEYFEQAIQNILLEDYNNALQNELDRVIEEKNISREDYEKIFSVHNQSNMVSRNIDA